MKFTAQGFVLLRASGHGIVDDKFALRIEVIDTGTGIPLDKLQTIFEKFTQADTSINRRFGGTGLGLAITRVLVAMHGGTIAVESEVGRGSRFTVNIPYELASVPKPPVPELSPISAGPALHSDDRGTILVVEDNLVNQKMVSSILRKHGFKVQITSNGQEAIEALQLHTFQLVLMDVQMPILDGLETTRLIRKDPRWIQLPIVAMTAHAMHGDREGCLAAGMNAYISKPVHSAHLLSVVEEYTLSGSKI